MTTTSTTRTTINPASAGLTDAQHQAYKILAARVGKSLTTTMGDIASAWKKNRSYTYRVVMALIEKGVAEKYDHIYYRTK